MRNLIILVLALSVLSSCNQSSTSSGNSKSVAEMTEILTSKLWRYDVPLIKEKFEILKSKMNPAQFEVVDNVLPRLQFATFEFTEDNKIKLNLNNGKSISDGTWVFSNNGNSLILTFSSVKEVPHKILEFSEDRITLEENVKAGILYSKIFIPLAEGAGVKQTTPPQQKEGKKTDISKNRNEGGE